MARFNEQTAELIDNGVACLVKANQLLGGPLADKLLNAQGSGLKDAIMPSSEALRHAIVVALAPVSP